jgi:hypothetical protein
MYEEEVARGAAWLDERVGPHWPLLIQPEKLRMSECSSCVIGQTFGLMAEVEARSRSPRAVWFGIGNATFYGFQQATQGLGDTGRYGFILPDSVEDEHDGCMFGDGDVDEEECEHWTGLREAWIAEAKRRLDEGVKV